jgi:hypothetical protein
MRKIVSEAWLRDEIAAHMSNPAWDSKNIFARPKRVTPKGDGLNWTYSFNPAAVPKGYAERWEQIRAKFEVFDLDKEKRGW